MQPNDKKTIRLLSLILVIISALALTVPTFAAFEDYDISDRGSDKTDEKSSTDLLEEHIGTKLSEAERSFIDSYSTLVLKYNSVINANKVSIDYTAGTLTVTANKFEYTAENGKKLVWIPERAIVDGHELPFTAAADTYIASLTADCAKDASVLYKASTEISKEDFNVILNLHYYTAKYASDIADYEAKLAAYEKYVYEKRLYDDALAEYNRYLEDLKEYNDILYKYEHYDDLMAQYEIDKAKYDAYIESLKTKAEDIKKYEEYLSKLEKIRKQLSAFELVYVRMKDDRDIYSAVMGGTVDQVLGSVGQIIKELGKEYKDMVETAERATKNVRGLMTEYRTLETEEEKYSFYVSNYTKMCESVYDLTWSLDRLYYAPGVKPGMKAFDKHEKYVILVAQLVLTSNALIDGTVSTPDGTVTYNEQWKMDKRTYSRILNNVTYFTDDNTSTPLAGGYPAEVPDPNIEVVENPTLPIKPSSKPIEPTAVTQPVAPQTVTAPTLPTPVVAQAKEVYSKMKSADISAMINGLNSGSIKQRTGINNSKSVVLQTILDKKCNSETVKLTFEVPEIKDTANAFQEEIITDSLTAVVYDGIIPKDYTDVTGSYRFAGWINKAIGKRVDLTQGFDSDTVLIPHYDRMPTYYTVTWIVGDEQIKEKHISGTVPTPSFVPSLPDSGDCAYVFREWYNSVNYEGVSELYSDVTYIARFDKIYLLQGGNGGANVTDDGSTVTCDVSEFKYPIFDLSVLMPKIAGKKSLTIVNNTTSSKLPVFMLSFSFTDVVKMSNAGVSSLIMRADFSNDESASFEVEMYNSSNIKITDSTIRPELNIAHSFDDVSNFVLLNNGEYTLHKIDANTVSLRINPSVKYTLKKEYSVTVVKNQLCDITVDKECGYKNDLVSFKVEAKPGVNIIGIDVTDEAGNPITLTLDGKIQLTDSNIVISVRAKYILYNVVFIANGVVISEQEVAYGSMPKAPKSPSVATDSEYSYKFAGWSPEVAAVTCDITYVAQFEKIPSPVIDPDVLPDSSVKLAKYLKIAIIVLSVVTLCVIGLITFLIVRGVRRNKRIAARLDAKKKNGEKVVADGNKSTTLHGGSDEFEGDKNALRVKNVKTKVAKSKGTKVSDAKANVNKGTASDGNGNSE